MRFFTFLLVALLVLAVVPIEARAQAANIDVPVLTNSVILDGQVTYSDEWSDAGRAEVTLQQSGSNYPTYPIVSISAKHDARCLYLLYRVALAGRYRAGTTASIAYFWGVKIAGNYEHSNMGTLNGSATDDFFGLKDGVWKRDVDFGGQNNVEGTVGYISDPSTPFTYYTFEFRKALDSGDGFDWVLSEGLTYYMHVGLSNVDAFYGLATPPYRIFGSFSEYVTFTILVSIAATTGSTSAAMQTTTSLASPSGTSFSTLSTVGLVAAVVATSSVLVFTKRRRVFSLATTLKNGTARSWAKTKPRASNAQPVIPTGYGELDRMLAGGIPEGYAVALVSQSYDERDLLIRKIIESTLNSGRLTFYLSNDIARIADLTARFSEKFYALSPVADRIALDRANLFKVPDVGDLSNLNISTNQIIEKKSNEAPCKMIVIDLVSDLLLRNKAITTRRWLSDFVGRRKAAGFTIVATLDPSIAPKEDVQTITGVFDGIIEVFEKELQERSRRFLVIKKMYGREYSDNELILDRKALI
jgi:KaiC/GvpD/RAD55 family RecA-like ATPase